MGLIFLMVDCLRQRVGLARTFNGLLILCNYLPGGSKMSTMPALALCGFITQRTTQWETDTQGRCELPLV